jgi:putative membrane protein
MIAYPAVTKRGAARRAVSSAVVGSLFATTTTAVAGRWGRGRAAIAATVVVIGAGVVEHVGVRSGRPFGRYAYTAALRPQIGEVPVVVPLAWFAMAVPAREVAHAALAGASNPFRRVLAGAAALTAWDLFLDPQMVGEGYWEWTRPGRYRSIPLSNFVGWFVVALGMMMLLELGLPPGDPAPDLVAAYAGVATMETIAFGTFFRDPVVAAVGGAAMLPVAALAVVRLVGHRA